MDTITYKTSEKTVKIVFVLSHRFLFLSEELKVSSNYFRLAKENKNPFLSVWKEREIAQSQCIILLQLYMTFAKHDKIYHFKSISLKRVIINCYLSPESFIKCSFELNGKKQ